MKKNILIGIFSLVILCMVSSCKKFLDVVPDNVATIDNAFTMRSQAEKFLFTCYSYMPRDGNVDSDPAQVGGDEIWHAIYLSPGLFNIAMGFQNKVNPFGDTWGSLYMGLRDCNTFLENIDKVPDLKETEKRQWVAEVKFLKAYYHFYLVRAYGPIPLIKSNLPVDADVNAVKVVRAPVDSCFSYIVKLLDEAYVGLPLIVNDPAKDLGRITQVIALSLKAQVLVTAASPLFNGNTDQAGLKNKNGTPLFSQTFSKEKWDSAAVACKRAIDLATQNGLKLYTYNPAFQQFKLSDTINTQMNIRGSITDKWNSEIIWANTQSNMTDLQNIVTPFLDVRYLDQSSTQGRFSPPLKIAEMFYSQNGVPINEDKTWDYNERYTVRTAKDEDKLYVRKGSTTAVLNFNREPRFYADLGFDGGIWYGQGNFDDKKALSLFYLQAKFKEVQGAGKPGHGTVTGYYIKKWVHYQNVINANGVTVTYYPWPIMRLGDLYLLYAEALNESAGPGPEVYKYINMVRERAGLKSVESSWTAYSTNPIKFTTQTGLRDIIHRERTIEMAFEAKRFWDLRRWKEASKELNTPISGWDVNQTTTDAYYKPKVIFNQTFGMKDYFWPIYDSNISVNTNLVQNLGW